MAVELEVLLILDLVFVPVDMGIQINYYTLYVNLLQVHEK